MGNWKMKTTTMCPGKGTTPPRKRRTAMSQLRKTRRQEASCALGHPLRTMMKMTVGTQTTESTAMMASPATMVPEMTAVTAAGDDDGDVSAVP
jgi:hypothetical protein